ncbi:MAG: ZIP family metal transporter [Nitrospinae bacterium]|nr:ZIP family metal transporter [Nitrospinota bacterium]
MKFMIYTLTIGSVILISIVSLIGILFISLDRNKMQKILHFLVSFAVGGLFGDAFIHLLPESFEKLGSNLFTSLSIVLGILIFFILEKFIRWRHCHITSSDEHLHAEVTLNIIGDGVHNLIDGILVGASYLTSIPIGITTTFAVILHEIPQEIGDFGVLVNGGFSVRKALVFNLLSAVTSILGAIISLVIGPQIQGYSLFMLPVTAGGFIYIAGSDLIPELQHDVNLSTSFSQLIFIILGIVVMSLLVLIE